MPYRQFHKNVDVICSHKPSMSLGLDVCQFLSSPVCVYVVVGGGGAVGRGVCVCV